MALLDLTVPGGMGGKETLAELRALDPGIAAIASSGYSSDPVMSDFAAHGFGARLPKPYRIPDLPPALERALAAVSSR